MHPRFLPWMLLTLLLTSAAPQTFASAAPTAIAAEPTGEQILQQGFTLMEAERLGELRLGLSEREVNQKVRCKGSRGQEVFWGAIGEYVQSWQYPTCGIALNMSSEKPRGAKQLLSMRINGQSRLKTKRGIGIGSPASAVMQAYSQFYNPADSQPGKTIVAGTIYGGVIFFLENGKVSEIFIGAAAE